MQQSPQPTFQENDTTTYANNMMEQSNIAGDVLLLDHTEIFKKCMDIYQIKGSNQEQEGFKMMDDLAMGIDHYEHYTGVTLTIEKSRFTRNWQCSCWFHEDCSFCVSLRFKRNSITLKMKNPYLVHSGIKHCKMAKDGCMRKM